MKVHMSKNMLKKTRFSVKKYEGRLNIKGYNEEKLEEKVCPNCLLKTFRKNDTIVIDEVAEESCKCNLALRLPPVMSLSLNINKNKLITIA